ncbi:glycosyltransferase family 2 protein, partial [Candidatus Kaiserbacteria bacterium]|nr:glycosyltransferase family 2 protein [Candidatus Kaiserbacteria bacterium]
MPPKVTIGLPVYNGEPFLEEALDAIVHQSFHDFELIISDNASTDNTEEICRRYAEQHPNIRYIRQPKNQGAAQNYNIVFEAATGE